MSSDKRRVRSAAEIEIEDPLDFLTAAEREAYAAGNGQRARETHTKSAGRERHAVTTEASSSDRALSFAVRLGALIIAVLLFMIVWLLFLRPIVRSALGSNRWTASQEENAVETYVITTSQLNLRNAPGTQNSEIVVTVAEGTRLARIAEADGWTTVLYEGQTLYCSSDYLREEE